MGEPTEYIIERAVARAVERAFEKNQQAVEASPQLAHLATSVQWMKWALSATVAGLSLFMFFVVYTLNTNFSRMDDRFTRMDARFAGIDARLDGIDVRFAGIDARLDGMDSSIKELTQAQKEHNELYQHQEKIAQLAIEHTG